jgi:hypothetical protein
MTEKIVSEAWQVMGSTGHVSAGVGPEMVFTCCGAPSASCPILSIGCFDRRHANRGKIRNLRICDTTENLEERMTELALGRGNPAQTLTSTSVTMPKDHERKSVRGDWIVGILEGA